MNFKFFADENIAKSVVKALRENGYDVKDIKEENLFGINDRELILKAKIEERIILTHDKDFANLSYLGHSGIILIQYKNQHPLNIINKFIPLLKGIRIEFKNSLVTIKDNFIKINRNRGD